MSFWLQPVDMVHEQLYTTASHNATQSQLASVLQQSPQHYCCSLPLGQQRASLIMLSCQHHRTASWLPTQHNANALQRTSASLNSYVGNKQCMCCGTNTQSTTAAPAEAAAGTHGPAEVTTLLLERHTATAALLEMGRKTTLPSCNKVLSPPAESVAGAHELDKLPAQEMQHNQKATTRLDTPCLPSVR